MVRNAIVYDLMNLITKFGQTQSQRYSEDWMRNKIDQVRSQLILLEFKRIGFTNPQWFQDLNLIQFTPVKESDLDYGICGECPVSKAIIPNNIPLFNSRSHGEDDGIKIISPCGTNQFYYYPLEILKQVPKHHIRNKFYYYWRIGNQIYVNKKLDKLRINLVCQNPEDVNSIQNTIIPSGQLVVGTSYTAIEYQVIYNGNGYNPGQTFTATSGITTYSGNGSVILTNPVLSFDEDTTNYPVTNDMARNIVLEIATKEFGITEQQVTAFKNEYGATNNKPLNKAAQT